MLTRLSGHDEVFARVDRLSGDPMTTQTVHATDVGYRRMLDERTRLSVAYQWKNAPTDNDDAVNTRLQITMSVEF